MSEVEKQESQKTVVSFIAGLLIGGLLVWVFGGDKPHDSKEMHDDTTPTAAETAMDDNEEGMSDDTEEVPAAPTLTTGAGSIVIANTAAGSQVTLGDVVYPNDEGWMGVRDYNNGQLSGLLGVARFSKEQNLVPSEIELLRATEAGKQYAVVFYSESGDRQFSLANDVQLEDVVEVFTAQ